MSSAADGLSAASGAAMVAARRESDLSSLMELTRSLASREDIFDILFSVVSRLADLLDVDRGSIVLCDEADDQTGIVVATSDDASMRNHKIALGQYPEIRQVFETGAPLVIRDVTQSPLLDEVLASTRAPKFSSMALIPVIGETGPVAALVLKSNETAVFDDYDIMHAQAVANATAIALNNARTLRKLRDESRALFSAHTRDREKLKEFGKYLDVFESAREAMLVCGAEGRVLFANPQAAALTRREAHSVVSVGLVDLFAAEDRTRIETLVEGFRQETYPAGLDFCLAHPASGSIVSVNFSRVLGEGEAVLVTMRDVTKERALASELAQTKEFLERVIESSVDGIVSADLRGNVLLYNRAAAKLFGYEPSEVFGKITVDRLYPKGVARDLMRRIRRPGHGGVGRLEEYRVEMLTKSGEHVPVSLSASLVLGATGPVGTVGIFTDIREKLAMEQRLAVAQEQLEERRRADAISEVAGAAAHELNQPLTSVMGYAEYLKRRVQDDTALAHAVEVILSETQRMADIVRKVGRITRYETKPYVGAAKIVDIDASSENSG
jgi:PAS domain S-box-containing protein